MIRLSVCSLGVSCNEMIDTPMLLVVQKARDEIDNALLKDKCFKKYLLNCDNPAVHELCNGV